MKLENDLIGGQIGDLFPQLKEEIEFRRLKKKMPPKFYVRILLNETLRVIPPKENFRRTYINLLLRAFKLGMLKVEDVAYAKIKEVKKWER